MCSSRAILFHFNLTFSMPYSIQTGPLAGSWYANNLAISSSPSPTAPPGRPENLTFAVIVPVLVIVTWDPPTDDGGTPDPLNYMVALTTTSDGQSVSANQTAQTQFTFTYTTLSHSENYTVSVVAISSLGQQGPSAVGTFRTRDICE